MATIWEKYFFDQNAIKEFEETYQIDFQFPQKKKICLSDTLSKILYWSHFNFNLNYNYNLESKINLKAWIISFIKFLKYTLKKYFKQRFKNSHKHSYQSLSRAEIIFFLNYSGEFEIIKDIYAKLNSSQINCSVVIYKKDIIYKEEELNHDFFNELMFNFPTIKLKKWPSKKAAYVFNNFINQIDELALLSFFFYSLRKINSLKKIIFVAGENQFSPNLAFQILSDRQIKLENLMNGAKYGLPIDRNCNFNTWYLWDQYMKRALMKNAGLKNQTLKVIGHPMQDYYTNFKPKGLSFIDKNNNYKYIVVFTTTLIYSDIELFYKNIFAFQKVNPSVQIVIKEHPSDKKTNMFLNERYNNQFINVKGLNKDLIFELISLAEVTISFGSTISYESIWMNKFNISIENSEKSNLPIESELFHHVNKPEKLLNTLQNIFRNKSRSFKTNCGINDTSFTELYVENISKW